MTRCTCCGEAHAPDTSLCPRTGQPVGSGPCGTRIDRYEVEKLLGDGGMGAVYRARHAMLNQAVAMKLLHAEFARRGDMHERFIREARAAAAIGNPHIIRVQDVGVTPDGRPFLVMELLEGEGLEALLRRERRLAPPRAVALVTQVLDGLESAHAAGIVHRDMKPANVFVRRTPDPAQPEFVTVLDFGISKILDPGAAQQHLTQTGTMIGTPVYMAPEQITSPKDIDRRADLYATGVMLYEMLSGRLPYDGASTAELIVKACTTPPIPLRDVAPDLPPPLYDVIDRALAREPAGRFQTASEFADALRRSLGGVHTLPTAPQGSGNGVSGWQPTAAVPVTAAPVTAVPPATGYASAPMTPGWGAPPPTGYAAPPATGYAAAPVTGYAAPMVPVATTPQASSGGVGRVIFIVLGIIGAITVVCCGVSMAVGVFSRNTSGTSGTSTPSQPQTPQTPQLTPVPAPPQPAPQYPSQTPQMTPMGGPSQLAPTNGELVQVDEPRIVGMLPHDAVVDALDEANEAMTHCRVSTAQAVSVLAIINPTGQVAITRPADDNTGDPSVARCVGSAFATQHVASNGTSGIVTFTAHLAPAQ